MKLTPTNLNKLTRWECFQFLYEVLDYAEFHDDETSELFTTKLAALRTSFDKYDEALVQEGKASADRLIEAEEKRDFALRKIYALIREYSDYYFETAKADAAKALLKVFKPYGTGYEIAAMAQDTESAIIVNLFQDFDKEENENHLVTLGIVAACNELRNQNSSFIEWQSKRRTENAEYVTGVVKDARIEVQNEFLSFVDVVNALAIVEGEEKYSDLKLKINNVFKEYTSKAKQRTKKKKEETEEEIIEQK